MSSEDFSPIWEFGTIPLRTAAAFSVNSQLCPSPLLGQVDIDQIRFEIPTFQRGLVWSKKKKKQFLNSLIQGWPTGAIVLTKIGSKDLTDGRREFTWHVIDGQQRLTTIYLILQYLKDGYQDDADADAEAEVEEQVEPEPEDVLRMLSCCDESAGVCEMPVKKDVEEEFEKLAFEEQEKDAKERAKENKGKGKKGFKKKDELVEGPVEETEMEDDFATGKVENYEELENAAFEQETESGIDHADVDEVSEIEGKE
jgi:hypothetical protein